MTPGVRKASGQLQELQLENAWERAPLHQNVDYATPQALVRAIVLPKDAATDLTKENQQALINE